MSSTLKRHCLCSRVRQMFYSMIDCHCHLADPAFNEDIDKVIQRARQAGVVAAVIVPEFATDFPRIIELAKQYPNFIFPCLGVHPVQKGFRSINIETDFIGVEDAIRNNKIYGIGEVGLDYSPRFMIDKEVSKQNQIQAFRRQAELANELNLPLNVHSRSANRQVIEALIEFKPNAGALMHACDGSAKNIIKGVQAGLHFSVPPSFSRNEKKRDFVANIPIEQLCLETDSPVLGLEPGTRNEPMNIIHSAKFIADVKQIPVEEVIRITTQNARRLFRIP